jgi:enoyl-CoA hydratase
MQNFENLIVDIRNDVLWVQVNRPARRNALSRATLAELGEACAVFAPKLTLKAAVVTGVGNEAFAAGGDVKEFAQIRTAEEAGELFDLASTALDAVRNFPVPVVAAVNGWALGGGAELAMACDYRVIASHASIGFIHASLNITSGFGGGADLMRTLGCSRAMRHELSGEALNAHEALQLGLVDAIAAEGEILEESIASFLRPILSRKPQVIRGYKAMAIAERQGLSLPQRRAIERQSFSHTWAHADHWVAVEASAQTSTKTK